jgi:cyclopropane fatty-acyl-phospholipid synthase-like methyltransferase
MLIKKLIRKIKASFYKEEGFYKKVKLSEKGIELEEYKEFLGGKHEHWSKRGEFQLFMLKLFGLEPTNSLLDIGCGPLRSGEYFIDFLNAGNYYGIDYNSDFISIAKQIVKKEHLSAKRPRLKEVNNFRLKSLYDTFDFVLLFSVLNHCNEKQHKLFFANLPFVLKKASKIIITHATWFSSHHTHAEKQYQVKVYENSQQLAASLNMAEYGWQNQQEIFPIVVLSNNE